MSDDPPRKTARESTPPSTLTVTFPPLPLGATGWRHYRSLPGPSLALQEPRPGRISARARFEWVPRDCWIGVFWRGRDGHLDIWLCLLPMLPLHITLWRSQPPPPATPTYYYRITSITDMVDGETQRAETAVPDKPS
jgi:hypothetical protein